MIAPARQAAFAALTAHEVKGTDLPAAIATARGALQDPRDQSLLTELVTGVTRMRLALDYQLGSRTSRPLAALDAIVLTALRLGAFQLLYMTRVPASAVVNDAVALTKRAGKTSAGGLVNAVLRAIARERDQLVWPDGPLAESLAIRHSHPQWLVERWLARYGEDETVTWLEFNNRAPRLCLAANRIRGSRDEVARRLAEEGVTTEPTERSSYGLQVTSGAALATETFRQGYFVVQDEASQLIAELGDAPPGRPVLDLCASPGGKTMTLAARTAPGQVRVIACDVRPRRVRLLQQTLRRLRLEASIVQVPTREALPFAAGAFGLVLVDAPCSGLGTLRRDPDIRWARTPDDLPRMAAAQLELLRRAAPLVAPGGTLVYATCSSEPDENEAVVGAFLESTADFTERQVHRTTPIADGLEAFYGAVLSRTV